MEHEAKEQNCVALEWAVHLPMGAMVRWYEILGYQIVKTNAVIKTGGDQMVKAVFRKNMLPNE